MDLFDLSKEKTQSNAPLAERMRARNLKEFIGQTHVVSET